MGVDIPVGFTAGPWRISSDKSGEVYSEAEYLSVCMALLTTAHGSANARLIALAPEMAAEIASLRAERDARIAGLEAERDRLREALSDIATEVREHGDDGLLGVVYRMQDCARAALSATPEMDSTDE